VLTLKLPYILSLKVRVKVRVKVKKKMRVRIRMEVGMRRVAHQWLFMPNQG
jgi:hypothetical protein